MKKNFPFRFSTLNERSKFYLHEFSSEKVNEFFKKNKIKKPQLCAIDAGSESGIIKNDNWKNIMFYFPFKELKEKIKKYNPEDIYYDRNVYENPEKILRTLKFGAYIEQELVFDIDSDNIKCDHPNGAWVCDKCLRKSYLASIDMRNALLKFFRQILIVYSGRGFHLHVLDEKAYLLSNRERERLNRKFSRFPIDPWVSAGNIRLIRMPYSLHGLVSRIVTPIYKINFKFDDGNYTPKFLKDKYS